jgi:hypothetical protein
MVGSVQESLCRADCTSRFSLVKCFFSGERGGFNGGFDNISNTNNSKNFNLTGQK